MFPCWFSASHFGCMKMNVSFRGSPQNGNGFLLLFLLQPSQKSLFASRNKSKESQSQVFPLAGAGGWTDLPLLEGLADAFLMMKLPFESREAKKLNEGIFELLRRKRLASTRARVVFRFFVGLFPSYVFSSLFLLLFPSSSSFFPFTFLASESMKVVQNLGSSSSFAGVVLHNIGSNRWACFFWRNPLLVGFKGTPKENTEIQSFFGGGAPKKDSRLLVGVIK